MLTPSHQLLEASLHSVPQQTTYGPDRLIVEVSRPHIIRHTYSVGLLWRSDQHVAEAAPYTTSNKHKRQPPMRSAEFGPVIPEIERR